MKTMRTATLTATVLTIGALLTDPADGVTVYVCEGQDLTLPWKITPGSGEEIVDITWLFSGHSNQMMAMFSHDSFFPSPSYSQRVQHVPNAGIILSHVTQRDAGNYSIEVNVRDAHSSLVTHTHSVTLHVASVSMAHTDASMTVRQEPVAAYDKQTDQYRIQLSCTSQGFQPPAVIWATPTGHNQRSSTKDGGEFSLLLTNPVSGGNYTCRLPSDVPAATCLPGNDSALEGATVYVDEVTARLVLLEAGHTALKKENDDLTAENGNLKTEVNGLKENATALLRENTDLRQSMHMLEESRQVSFHARLSSDVSLSSGSVLKPNRVITNQGNAYHQSTGYFTAPYTGTYVFLVTTGPNSSSRYSYLDLVLENTMKCEIRTYWSSSYGGYEMGTCHAALHMTKGQRVWLKSAYSTSYFQSDVTSFSGYIVSSDEVA